MYLWPPPRKAIRPIAVVLSVLALAALIKQWFFPAGLLAAAAVVFWIAPRSDQLMLFLTTPGHIVRDEARDVELYATNPRYRAMVARTLRRQEDRAYRHRVDQARETYSSLVEQRKERLDYLKNGQWTKDNGLRINDHLGQVMINSDAYSFSSIKGAEITTVYSQRIEKTEHSEGEEKRTPSIGGAVVGGLVGGVVGAAVGAAVFSKKRTTDDRSYQGQYIPTCTHIGVKVNMDGFVCEIPILDHTVDQGTREFSNAMAAASLLVTRLRQLSMTPVPQRLSVPEKEPEILALDAQIAAAERSIRSAVAEAPSYELPVRYANVVIAEEPPKAAASAPEEAGSVTVICPRCGGIGRLPPGTDGICEYCGGIISAADDNSK